MVQKKDFTILGGTLIIIGLIIILMITDTGTIDLIFLTEEFLED